MVLLDQKLNLIDEAIRASHHPETSVLYFTPDAPRKTGGSYQEHTGIVRKIDAFERRIVFFAGNGRSAGKNLAIDDIMRYTAKRNG